MMMWGACLPLGAVAGNWQRRLRRSLVSHPTPESHTLTHKTPPEPAADGRARGGGYLRGGRVATLLAMPHRTAGTAAGPPLAL